MGMLTGEEKERYDQQFVPKLIKPEEDQALKESGQTENKEVVSEESSHPEIESISIKNEKDLSGVESLQDKISKGIRDIFGSRKTSEEEEMEAPEENDQNVQEEMIRNPSSEKEFENVPELEPENGNPTENPKEFSQEMKMPKLEIPESMKNMDVKEVEIPKVPMP